MINNQISTYVHYHLIRERLHENRCVVQMVEMTSHHDDVLVHRPKREQTYFVLIIQLSDYLPFIYNATTMLNIEENN